MFPNNPPKVHCNTKIFHPNIDLKGNVCLNILRKDWTAVRTMYEVFLGLISLFNEPNATDPLNEYAAEVLYHNPQEFD